MVLTLLDGALTLLLVNNHYVEANPLMAYALERGKLSFLISKLALTAVGVGFLVCARTYRLFGTKLQVARLLPILAALYLVLLGYQGYLLAIGPDESRTGPIAKPGAVPR